MIDGEFLPISDTQRDGSAHVVRRDEDIAVAHYADDRWWLGSPDLFQVGSRTASHARYPLHFEPIEYRVEGV